MDYKLLGKNIRKYRKQKGLCQEELAEMVGCTSSHIGHIENARGIPSVEMTVNIANALSVSVDQLLIESMDWPETIYLRDIESRLRKFPAPLKEVACELLDDFMHLLERSLLREVINSEHHQWPAKRDKHGF